MTEEPLSQVETFEKYRIIEGIPRCSSLPLDTLIISNSNNSIVNGSNNNKKCIINKHMIAIILKMVIVIMF